MPYKDRDKQLEYWRQYHQENREKLNKQSREYWHENREELLVKKRQHYIENREVILEQQREYYQANREAIKARTTAYRKAHPEQHSQYTGEWAKAHPELYRECQRRRKARKNEATIGPVDEAAVYALNGRMCIYCGAIDNLELDHIHSLAGGGPHCEDNLVVACRRCNASKQDKPLAAWLQTQPYSIAWVF